MTEGCDIAYRVIRSDRRTVAIQIDADGSVTVRCPRRMKAETIDDFVKRKARWIEKQLKKNPEKCFQSVLREEEIYRLLQQAREAIPQRVAFYAQQLGVTYGRVTIRTQRTRWGSCSSEGNLNFNCLLMLAPAEVADYVVVHELCHRKEMNHSRAFWGEVAQILPDYQTSRRWLRENGGGLICRLQRGQENGLHQGQLR